MPLCKRLAGLGSGPGAGSAPLTQCMQVFHGRLHSRLSMRRLRSKYLRNLGILLRRRQELAAALQVRSRGTPVDTKTLTVILILPSTQDLPSTVAPGAYFLTTTQTAIMSQSRPSAAGSAEAPADPGRMHTLLSGCHKRLKRTCCPQYLRLTKPRAKPCTFSASSMTYSPCYHRRRWTSCRRRSSGS